MHEGAPAENLSSPFFEGSRTLLPRPPGGPAAGLWHLRLKLICRGRRRPRKAGYLVTRSAPPPPCARALFPPAAARLKAAEVDRTPRGWEKTSDHTPVWIELEI